jgi:hypothetical protein
MAERKQRHQGHGKAGSRTATQLPPKLADLGITKTQSSNWKFGGDACDQKSIMRR